MLQPMRGMAGSRTRLLLTAARPPTPLSRPALPQIIMQLFHWTRNPSQAAKIVQRKEEIYDSIMNGMQPAEVPGCRGFLDTLRNYNVSVLRRSIRGL